MCPEVVSQSKNLPPDSPEVIWENSQRLFGAPMEFLIFFIILGLGILIAILAVGSID